MEWNGMGWDGMEEGEGGTEHMEMRTSVFDPVFEQHASDLVGYKARRMVCVVCQEVKVRRERAGLDGEHEVACITSSKSSPLLRKPKASTYLSSPYSNPQ